jgi:hypothetical protein
LIAPQATLSDQVIEFVEQPIGHSFVGVKFWSSLLLE